MFDDMIILKAKILNSGLVAGAEVAQLYLGLPESTKSPLKQLRGFQKIHLEAGESKTVDFVLQRRDLSFWDSEMRKWKVEAGKYTAMLGRSSRDIVSSIELEIEAY